MREDHPDNFGSSSALPSPYPASPLHVVYLMRNYTGQLLVEMLSEGPSLKAEPQPALQCLLSEVRPETVNTFKTALTGIFAELIEAHEKIRAQQSTASTSSRPTA